MRRLLIELVIVLLLSAGLASAQDKTYFPQVSNFIKAMTAANAMTTFGGL